MYSVIRFPKDKKVCVILDKWRYKVGKDDWCFWPGAKTLQIALKNDWNVDKKTWLNEQIELKKCGLSKLIVNLFLLNIRVKYILIKEVWLKRVRKQHTESLRATPILKMRNWKRRKENASTL